MKFSTGELINGDCLEVMKSIPDNSVDMILCDLPYGTTQNKWDTVIPFEPLWENYWRIAKEKANIVLFSQQPFTTRLIISNIDNFRYEIIWEKTNPKGFLNAPFRPLVSHENIIIFYKNKSTYNPQTWTIPEYLRTKRKILSETRNGEAYGDKKKLRKYDDGTRQPTSIISFANRNTKHTFHPTQKPVELFEYLIKTYTNEGDTVLDNCSGSGTTAIAAIQTNRKWICIEKDEEYYRKSCERISKIREDILTYEG